LEIVTVASTHLDELVQRIPALVVCRNDLDYAFTTMRDAFKADCKVLLCGNGGSAADADHWAGELLKGFRKKRALSLEEKALLPAHLAQHLQGALAAIPLTSLNAATSAFANDVVPELSFAQIVWGLGRTGDVFVGISTSGDAKNVCAAAKTARARGLRTIALTGETGGALRPLCDIAIRVPAKETYLAQEYHLPIYHCLSMMLEDELFPDS
jgi:D-sedoheptulose 7-phosphate isomerase